MGYPGWNEVGRSDLFTLRSGKIPESEAWLYAWAGAGRFENWIAHKTDNCIFWEFRKGKIADAYVNSYILHASNAKNGLRIFQAYFRQKVKNTEPRRKKHYSYKKKACNWGNKLCQDQDFITRFVTLLNEVHAFFYKNIVYKNIEAEIWFNIFDYLKKYLPWNIFDCARRKLSSWNSI